MKRALAASLLLLPVFAFAYVSPGKPLGYVSDFAGMLKPETVAQLNTELKSFEDATQAEVAVVTVPSIGTDETIETYANKLFTEWGIGKAKHDTGLLLLISRDTHEARIEVGYGVEPSVTDIESSHIISDVLVPAFQNGDYDGGVKASVTRIEQDIQNGEPFEKESGPSHINLNSGEIYFFFFVILIIGRILGRTKSWWLGGVLGGVAGVIIGFILGLTAGIIGAIILIPFGLLLDYFFSKHNGDGRGGPPFIFWGGGRSGGSGLGGGFGGFGGGSSGGGGASGRW